MNHNEPTCGLWPLVILNSTVFIMLMSTAWNVLYHAQRRHTLATAGPYARVRHPQYVAFVRIVFGFLLQWPTPLTLLMFPVLLVTYRRLAITEVNEMRSQFGVVFDQYAARAPRLFPSLIRERATRWKAVLFLQYDVHGQICCEARAISKAQYAA